MRRSSVRFREWAFLFAILILFAGKNEEMFLLLFWDGELTAEGFWGSRNVGCREIGGGTDFEGRK
jgi:hypothetical protein